MLLRNVAPEFVQVTCVHHLSTCHIRLFNFFSDTSKSFSKRKIEDVVDLNSDKLNLEKDRAMLSRLRADDYTPFSRLTVLSATKVVS